jgi:transcriptional regulator with XRE-family HTH domain
MNGELAKMTDKNVITDPEWMVTIGRRLRALRKARGETQSQTAARAQLDRETVSRAERGDNPTLLTVIRLLRAFDRIGALESFIPEPGVSPMALLRKKNIGPRSRRGDQGDPNG